MKHIKNPFVRQVYSPHPPRMAGFRLLQSGTDKKIITPSKSGFNFVRSGCPWRYMSSFWDLPIFASIGVSPKQKRNWLRAVSSVANEQGMAGVSSSVSSWKRIWRRESRMSSAFTMTDSSESSVGAVGSSAYVESAKRNTLRITTRENWFTTVYPPLKW